MSVDLKTDIVADVLGAADPGAAAAARQRLADSAAKAGAAAPVRFEAKVAHIEAPKRTAPSADNAAMRFEAMVLRSFIESMLPDEAENIYGNGLAGDMWKSTMAEKIADQIASGGGIGIANRLLADFTMNGENPEALKGITDPREVVAEARSREALRGITINADLDFVRDRMKDTGL